MINKIYEVSCDLCGFGLNHYIGFRPTTTDLRQDGIKVRINNGKILTYCEDCYDKIKGSRNEKGIEAKEGMG